MTTTTLERLLQAVFSGADKKNFESGHRQIPKDEIRECLLRTPYSLSKSQKQAIYTALGSEISYIQGPPGTGKSFTISALAIAASKMGLKVLVASQKTSAVSIVHEKVSEVLGDSACLYISEDQKIKQKTRGTIDDLLRKVHDYQMMSQEKNKLQKLSDDVDNLVQDRHGYDKNIFKLESTLRQYYLYSEKVEKLRKILKEDFDLSDDIIRKINLLSDEEICGKVKRLLNECIKIREQSREKNGKAFLKQAVRLRILSTTLLRILNFDPNQYKKYKEGVLQFSLDYSFNLANAQTLWRIIKDDESVLKTTRKLFNRCSQDLYPSKPGDSILAKYLAKHHSIRINDLLRYDNYRHTLEAFYRRLRWKNARRAKQANSRIDFRLLFQIFPIVMGEIKCLHPYLPFEEESFDLLILDEASQVNLAEIFPILYRAKRFCIVGDHLQLGIEASGVIFINQAYERLAWQKRFPGVAKDSIDFDSAKERDLLVSRSSILDLIYNEKNPIPSTPVVLNEHFRSLPMLAECTRDLFYKSKGVDLNIMTALPDKKALNAFRDLQVPTGREENSQINKGEVDQAFEIIESFVRQKPIPVTEEVFAIPQLQNKSISVGVVSFIRDQVNFMNEEKLKHWSSEEQESISLMIGTPEEFQGNERDVMISTPSLDKNQTRLKSFMEGKRGGRKRLNVATSRAKYFMYFIHGQLPGNMQLMEQIRVKMGQGRDEIRVMDQGVLPIGWSYKDSKCDSNFEYVVADILKDCIEEEYPQRLVLYNQVHTCGYYLDFVVYDRTTKKSVGIEVDGKHHFLDDGTTYSDEHLERANALKRAGWEIKHLPYWNWFQDGWIERDAAAAEDLRQFIRDFSTSKSNSDSACTNPQANAN